MSNSSSSGSLRSRLAAVLPKNHRFDLFHLSTPPVKTDALCSAPPNERPDRTYCEKHFLAVSVAAPYNVLILGLEIFVYSTAYATTLFVSKADSTGYLSLLGLPKSRLSPTREICTAFIAYLVENRRRSGIQLVVSLFARAQGQYLFPGSVKHDGKHVLDDRGLVKWWCRVLDPLLDHAQSKSWARVQGYLVIPGVEPVEARAFLPRFRSEIGSEWLIGHPLERISHYRREFDWVPPRCLIPRFPDDPKSRFRDELDEEAAKSGLMRNLGSWKSVTTLDTFWEVMGFRQECSSGRLTGFIWVVFDDEVAAQHNDARPQTPSRQPIESRGIPKTTPKKLRRSVGHDSPRVSTDGQKQDREKTNKKRKRLKGTIKARQPRIKTTRRNYLADMPSTSKYYIWPSQGRGERIVDEGDYKRIVDLLLHLDFATPDKASGSSRRWIDEAGMGVSWGLEVTGMRELQPATEAPDDEVQKTERINNLSGLVKRKR
ncbi:H3 K56 histone acetylation protein KAT11 [Ophiocordyceps camponoti-floridani]|uniref:histone acetyltransferase n=1 Tax=Ophiocordyceps camponoti-floridani TaxID=2030778 RepID=A0A8H4QEJ0_9HYPO|nr:H3 K56 histone acetylation protein KAT11 [Ophiocordyceps camponoti-floridani]